MEMLGDFRQVVWYVYCILWKNFSGVQGHPLSSNTLVGDSAPDYTNINIKGDR